RNRRWPSPRGRRDRGAAALRPRELDSRGPSRQHRCPIGEGPTTMIINVLYFAQARERAGRASAALELPDGSRVDDALAAIRRAHPALDPLWPHLAIAVDGVLVPGA